MPAIVPTITTQFTIKLNKLTIDPIIKLTTARTCREKFHHERFFSRVFGSRPPFHKLSKNAQVPQTSMGWYAHSSNSSKPIQK
jgi:hypothetical protein